MMFRGIAEFAMQGRWQAAVATALLSVAAALLPPVAYLASGVISLTTLRMGPSEGAKVVTATLILFTLLAGLLLGNPWLVGLILLSSWLPVFLVTLALGYTRSLSTSVLAAAGLGVITVVLMHVFIADPATWWQQQLAPIFQTLSEQANWQLNDAQTAAMIAKVSLWMSGIIAAGITTNALLGLLIGRSWQSKLYNQGAFATEFRQLSLGKVPAAMTAVIMAISLTPVSTSLSILTDCLFVLLVVFTLQGLAVVHAIVHDKQKSKAWLVAIYVMLALMMPQLMIILATLGVLDQWFNFRKLTK